MAAIRDLIGFLDELLNPLAFEDFGPNGLQVPGREETETVATGVTASVELFERAAAAGAGLVVVHHGLFFGPLTGGIDRALHRRLVPLFRDEVALAAYHLPLDAHLEVGNNALLARRLGAERVEPAFEHRGRAIGVVATLAEPGVSLGELVERTRTATDREPLVFDAGPEPVRRVGIVTGGGSSYLGEAIDAGLDAFLTGEPAERVMTQAREGAIHFLAAGHYATETFGVRRLGELLAERFGVRHLFVDDPNPV